MIDPISDLPDGVVGFDVSGDLDYRDIAEMMQAIAEASGDRKVGLLIRYPDGAEAGAAQEALRFDMWRDARRTLSAAAVVCPPSIAASVDAFRDATGLPVARFPPEDASAAAAWLAARRPDGAAP